MNWGVLTVAFGFGYLLGSVPFGLLLTRIAGVGDIREIGSGNIGATNVLRTGRRGLAAGTLLLDALKGTAASLLAGWLLGRDAALAAAVGAFIGHCYPVWLGFRGGKGVATFMGCVLALDWRAFLAFALTWIAVAAASRFSSVAGLTSTLVAALVPWWFGDLRASVALMILTAISWWKHRANIARLAQGTETRIGQKS